MQDAADDLVTKRVKNTTKRKLKSVFTDFKCTAGIVLDYLKPTYPS
jgi:hypothetical protein